MKRWLNLKFPFVRLLIKLCQLRSALQVFENDIVERLEEEAAYWSTSIQLLVKAYSASRQGCGC